jgi:WD40 repeat protein
LALGDFTAMPRQVLAVLAGLLLAPAAQAQPAVDAVGDPLPPGAVARLGTLRLKHPSISHLSYPSSPLPQIVTAIRYSADGSKFVSRASAYGTVSVWEASTGKARPGAWDKRVFSADEAFALSSDGAVLAVYSRDLKDAGRDAAVHLWDVSAGTLLRSLPTERSVHSLEFVDGGKTLVTTDADAVRWWDVTTGREWRSWKPFGKATMRDWGHMGLPPTVQCNLVLSAGAKHIRATVQVVGAQRRLGFRTFFVGG